MSNLPTRPLFGGAIILPLPPHFLDASDLRQIPDTQEVFLSPDSDTSVIVEILEEVEEGGAKDDLGAAIAFHFSSLAHDNSALSSSILTSLPHSTPSILPTPSSSSPSALTSLPTPLPYILLGRQSVRKFPRAGRPESEQPPVDEVSVFMALWRVLLPPVPSVAGKGEGEGNGAQGGKGWRKADLVMTVNTPLKDGEEELEKVKGWFGVMKDGLVIKDYGLFEERE